MDSWRLVDEIYIDIYYLTQSNIKGWLVVIKNIMNRIDTDDLKILSVMRKDSRAQLTEISKLTGIPTTTLHQRIKNLRETLIKKFSTIIDFQEMGFLMSANVLIKTKTNKEMVQKYLERQKSVNTLYEINDGWDFMMEVIFESLKQLEQFLEEIDEKFTLKKKQVHYILQVIKKEEFLTDVVQ